MIGNDSNLNLKKLIQNQRDEYCTFTINYSSFRACAKVIPITGYGMCPILGGATDGMRFIHKKNTTEPNTPRRMDDSDRIMQC